MQNFGIGIVGCGNISDTHAEAIKNSRNGTLVAAHSRTEKKLNKFCKKYDIEGSASYEEFLNLPDLDMVAICTPSGTHLDYGKLAAAAGKHVIVEKPIEITVDRGKSLIETCEKNNVQLAVIFQNRFIDDVVEMKNFIDAGKVGKIVMASASVKWFRDQKYYSNSNWRGTFALDGGGAVINQAIHTLDLLQWMAGDIQSVSGYKGTLTHEDMEAEDNAVASLHFKNGALGTFTASTSIVPAQERNVEINGTKGTLQLEGDDFVKNMGNKKTSDSPKNSDESTGADSPLAGMTAELHRKQYDQILEAFSKNNEPIVSGKESLKSLAVVEALYQSAKENRSVDIDDFLN